MTVDGFIAGPNGEMDWTAVNWDDKLKKFVGDITETVDCILLGRKLAQGFIPYWASHPEEEGADKFNSTKKVVFTKTLEKSEWDNTMLAKGDITDEITRLKKLDGQDMIAYGGAEFVSALIKNRLIDEFYFFINPAVIGNGLSIFKELTGKQSMVLVNSEKFDCGIVVLNYKLLSS